MRRFVVYLIVVLVALLATIPVQARGDEHDEDVVLEPGTVVVSASCDVTLSVEGDDNLNVVGEVFEEYWWWGHIATTVVVDPNGVASIVFYDYEWAVESWTEILPGVRLEEETDVSGR
ncbi:MAG: hypothetical protein OXC05_08490 [Halieaceae bacterium]|nr:hypothetical protein [Halieaceae bacterium]